MATQPDVLVIGAGIMGLWSAWAALDAGLSVTVLDRAEPGAGASGGVIGALAPHLPDRWNAKKQFQLEALLALPDALRRVEALSRVPTGYGRTGRMQPLFEEGGLALARDRAGAAPARWGRAATMEVLDPDQGPPGFTRDLAGWLHDSLTARLDPAATCAALAQAIAARGARIRTGVEVLAVRPGAVETSDGPVSGGAIILAAGVPAFDLLAPLVGEVAGRAEKGQALLLDHAGTPDQPVIYGKGTYIIAHASGHTAVGATSERAFADPLATDAQLERVWQTAVGLCPALGQARVLRRWAGLRPRANGRDPMLGAVPDVPGVHAMMGGFKISFGIAEKAARHVIEEITTGATDLPESFRVPAHLGL